MFTSKITNFRPSFSWLNCKLVEVQANENSPAKL
jgi:hypothetical protein